MSLCHRPAGRYAQHKDQDGRDVAPALGVTPGNSGVIQSATPPLEMAIGLGGGFMKKQPWLCGRASNSWYLWRGKAPALTPVAVARRQRRNNMSTRLGAS